MDRPHSTTATISVIALLALVLAPCPGLASPLPHERAEPVGQCLLAPVARVRENFPAPAIRSRPSARASILARIDPGVLPGDEGLRGVDIVTDRLSGQWLHIAARQGDRAAGSPPTPAGWIAFADVYFTMQTQTGFARPDASSRKVLAAEDWISREMITAILDCRGEWLKLAVRPGDGEGTLPRHGALTVVGWFRGFCGIEETTCDGVTGD